MVPFPPRCAQRFRAVRVLASGGFGSVYLAEQIGLDRPVAMKLLDPGALTDETTVKRFLAEARITASLSHPTIVDVIDHDVEAGIPWIAYEYLPGRTVRSHLDTGALPLHVALEVARCVAEALEVAHARGIVHRDVKPENVLEDPAARWKLVDFGIAYWDGSRRVKTATGMVVGTPAYLAPELLTDGATASPAADLYALGAMLHEMVSGKAPFVSDHPADVMRMHLTTAPPRLGDLVPDVPRALEVLVLRLLEKRPRDRLASAAELRVALEATGAGGEPLPGKRPAAPDRAGRVAAPVPPPQKVRTGRRTAGLVGAMLAVAGFALASRKPPRPETTPPFAHTVAAPRPGAELLRTWYPGYLARAREYWKTRIKDPPEFDRFLKRGLAAAPASPAADADLLTGLLFQEVKARGETLLSTKATPPAPRELQDHVKDVEALAALALDRLQSQDAELTESNHLFMFVTAASRAAQRLKEFLIGRFEVDGGAGGGKFERDVVAIRLRDLISKVERATPGTWLESVSAAEQVRLERWFEKRAASAAETRRRLERAVFSMQEAAQRLDAIRRAPDRKMPRDRGDPLYIHLRVALAEARRQSGDWPGAARELEALERWCGHDRSRLKGPFEEFRDLRDRWTRQSSAPGSQGDRASP